MLTDRAPRAATTKAASGHALLAATALASGLLAALPAAAQPAWNAMPVTGLYVGAGVGVNFLQQTDLDQSGSVTAGLRAAGFPAPSGKATFDPGVATVGSVGWGFGNGLRAEGEFSYRWNDVDSITGFGRLGPAFRNAGGQQQTIGLMANLLYDFQLPGSPWVVPYLG
ncbi:MAG TPA: outer membrane beta-barrel protein, partial [Acetobacteraceae bacterium]|nr:outer membrane beta-barrel protein [Acetobacteraceae bacterium]